MSTSAECETSERENPARVTRGQVRVPHKKANTRSTGGGLASVNAKHRRQVRVLIMINADLERENDRHKIRRSTSKCGYWAQEW